MKQIFFVWILSNPLKKVRFFHKIWSEQAKGEARESRAQDFVKK